MIGLFEHIVKIYITGGSTTKWGLGSSKYSTLSGGQVCTGPFNTVQIRRMASPKWLIFACKGENGLCSSMATTRAHPTLPHLPRHYYTTKVVRVARVLTKGLYREK